MSFSDRESHKQPAIGICATQHVIPCFARRVSSIRSKDERCIEENLLSFAIGDLVEIPVLVTIRFIPLKSDTICDNAVHDGRMVPQSAQFDKRPRKGSVAGIDLAIIDVEYPGHGDTIRRYLLNLLRRDGLVIHKERITFDYVGKSSPAHNMALATFRGEQKPDKVLTAATLLDLI